MKLLYKTIPRCVECPFYKEEDSMSSGYIMPTTYIHKCSILLTEYTWTSIKSRNYANELMFQNICGLPDYEIII